MSWTTTLAGLPEEPALAGTIALLRYLLLLGLLDCAAGRTAAGLAGRSKVFYLPRCGYKKWVRLMLGRSWLAALPVLAAALALSLWRSTDPAGQLLTAAAILALNMLVLIGVQSLLIALFGAAVAGFVPLILTQLLSLFVSKALPGTWKLLLPGNWGMAARSVLAQPDGWPLLWVLGVEAALALVLWAAGWRLVRFYDRKGGNR